MQSPARAIVTGAAGFIGSHMVDVLLENGYQVVGIDDLSTGRIQNLEQHKDNPQLQFVQRDLLDLASRDDLFEGIDYVFHFAGRGDIVPSVERPVEYLSVNVMATIKTLEAARYARVKKLIYAASSSCYGHAKIPTDEDAPIAPQYPYALSKRLGEEAVLHWGHVYKLPVVSLRIFNAFGPRARTSGAYGAMFGVFLAQKLAGKPFTVVGDGTQRRDFVFVRDVARAFFAAANLGKNGEVYNVGTGHPRSVNEVIRLLEGAVVHLPKRPGEPECTCANVAKIRRELGWEPRTSFEEGVRLLLEKMDDWHMAPVWDAQSIQSATRIWFEMLAGYKEAI